MDCIAYTDTGVGASYVPEKNLPAFFDEEPQEDG